MNQTDDILQVANVKLGEVIIWLKNNNTSPLIQERNLKILKGVVKENSSLHELAKENEVTYIRILQIYYQTLRKVCAIIKSEKENSLNPKPGKKMEITYDVLDVMLVPNEKDEKKIIEILNRSVYTIVWSDKILNALKRNDITYIGELVNAYRKLHYTPKLGGKSVLNIEKELFALGLKFLDKDISPQKKVFSEGNGPGEIR